MAFRILFLPEGFQEILSQDSTGTGTERIPSSLSAERILEDSILNDIDPLRTEADSVPLPFASQDCCKQHVGLVQLNRFCYSPLYLGH